MEFITLRNQAFSPHCDANIIGQGDLVKQGFTFVRGEDAFVQRESDGLRIEMTQKQGLTFWRGVTLTQSDYPNVKSVKIDVCTCDGRISF
jgi:hypothetical protein